MTLLQLKPYLEARRTGGILRIGNMPPRGIELESVPVELDRLLAVLSEPTTVTAAAQAMAGIGEVPAEGWTEGIEQLVDAGVVGDVITDAGKRRRYLEDFNDLSGLAEFRGQLKQSSGPVVPRRRGLPRVAREPLLVRSPPTSRRA
ncbi:hypothetical protein L0U85_07765 [Glycomyces sp. L485]|uniref:hypothetical protein n=1 Tax=Glycomyces sp. L485 TaxID=2909235 RepID=UPI001F4B9B23|nr:hypothetical protein [Glycomyces sp. L485]MCH7230747.1 hypothetical protein [Glycomyces sp. L485]